MAFLQWRLNPAASGVRSAKRTIGSPTSWSPPILRLPQPLRPGSGASTERLDSRACNKKENKSESGKKNESARKKENAKRNENAKKNENAVRGVSERNKSDEIAKETERRNASVPERESAKENETEFYKLWSKMIPHEVAGEGGGPMIVVVRFVDE